MKTDFYTKTVLTIIAGALVLLVLKNSNFVNEAKADQMLNKNYVSIPVNADGSINVKMTTMDVNIQSIGGTGVYGALPINLKEIGGSSFYGSLPINLKEVNGSSFNSSGLPVNIEALNGSDVFNALPVKMAK